MDDATYQGLDTGMQHEDEAEKNAAKTEGDVAVDEAAEQDRAKKVGQKEKCFGALCTIRELHSGIRE